MRDHAGAHVTYIYNARSARDHVRVTPFTAILAIYIYIYDMLLLLFSLTICFYSVIVPRNIYLQEPD